MQNPHLEEFNQFWIDNFRDEVPALPKKPSDLNITPADVSNVLQENEYFKLLCINKAQARVIETLQNACEVLKSEVNKLTEEKGVKNAKGG